MQLSRHRTATMSSAKQRAKRRPKSKNLPSADPAREERRITGQGPASVITMPGFFQPDAEALRYWRARSELITRGAVVKRSRGRAA